MCKLCGYKVNHELHVNKLVLSPALSTTDGEQSATIVFPFKFHSNKADIKSSDSNKHLQHLSYFLINVYYVMAYTIDNCVIGIRLLV